MCYRCPDLAGQGKISRHLFCARLRRAPRVVNLPLELIRKCVLANSSNIWFHRYSHLVVLVCMTRPTIPENFVFEIRVLHPPLHLPASRNPRYTQH